MESAEKIKLRQCIETAFGTLSVPLKVVPKMPYLDLERDDIANFFIGKTWQKISGREILNKFGSDWSFLSLMTPNAVLYYLPLIMNLALDENDEYSPDAFQSAEFQMSPARDAPDLLAWFFSLYSGITQLQIVAIAQFLDYTDNYNRALGVLDTDGTFAFAAEFWRALSHLEKYG